MEAIVLAGGLGTRLRSVVSDVPKPMAPVRGRPYLEHQLEYWIGQGVESFVISTGYKAELIENHFGKTFRGVSIKYAREDSPLGTGGGIALAAERLQPGTHQYLILNGDTFAAVKLDELVDFHNKAGSHATLALKAMDKNDRYGTVRLDPDGRVTGFESFKEGQSRQSPSLINAGVYLVRREVISKSGYRAGQKFSMESQLFPEMVARNEAIFGLVFNGLFIDIGLPEDYKRAEFILPERG